MNRAKQDIFSMFQERRFAVSLKIAFLATFLLTPFFAGCHCRLRNKLGETTFVPVVPSSARATQNEPETELIVKLDDRVEKISLSPNQRRMLVETRVETTQNDEAALYSSNHPVGVELWNIGFGDARPEFFTQDKPFLLAPSSNSAAFDPKGERIFWTDREFRGKIVQSLPANMRDFVVRGAAVEENSFSASDQGVRPSSYLSAPQSDELVLKVALSEPPLYLPWENDDPAPEADDNASFPDAQTSILMLSDDESVLESPQRPTLDVSADDQTDMADALTDDTAETATEDAPVEDEESAVDQIPDSKVEFKAQPLRKSKKIIVPEMEEEPIVNVVLTKPLDSDTFIIKSTDESQEEEEDAKHMMTPVEMKNAQHVWISAGSKWMVCDTANEIIPDPIVVEDEETDVADPLPEKGEESDAESTETESATAESADETATKTSKEETSEKSEPETPDKSEDVTVPQTDPWSKDWALVPLRDRRRVVRFPETIKMTFDSSTSSEEIVGKVVDVLAISDAEDLVATLVEEVVDESGVEPRYKIVIWDLNVALTVDLEKAIIPLRALEVSQIAIPYRVSRKYCKFSPSGKSFAARVDPKYVSVWQSTNGRSVVELGEHSGVVEDFEFSRGETRMVVGTSGPNSQALIWEIRKGVLLRSIDNITRDVRSIDAVTFSPNDRFVYFANNLGEIRRWNLHPKKLSID